MFKRAALGAILFSALSLSSAHAADLTLPPVLKMAQDTGGLQVLKDFSAAGGLRGWVVKERSSNQHTIVYTTQDGEVLIAGMAVDKEGRNLTSVYATEHLPKPDYSPAFKAFAPGGEAAGVTVGSSKAPAEITVLFDANCGYCKLMHRLVKPAVEAGELRVHYVPVGMLSADSATKGAGLLAAKDALAGIDSLAAGNAERSDDKALLAKVQANTSLMQKHGFNGTPVVLYKVRAADGETLMVAPGVPSMSTMFKALGISGQTEKLKADPALSQYLR